jgi:hypothetical protein
MRALDPANSRFVDSTKLPKGQYAGRAVCEIATTTDGLLYLDKMSQTGKRPDWCSPRLTWAVQRFLARPENEARVDMLYRQSR